MSPSDRAAGERVTFGAPVTAVAKPAPPVRLWNARPGLPIAAVFATEDGSAAVSIDQANHTRLWPSLDGKREPWMVPLTMPTEIAVARDGDGFALAALDQSGGLELAAITAAGELVVHVKQPPEPGFDAVVAHGAGFLVVRRDQTLEQLDLRGERVGVLYAKAGEHVVKLLHRKGRTLALVRAKDGLKGRWLADDALAWGDATPKLAIADLNDVHLSPDHEHLATFRQPLDELGAPMIVDLATGRAKALKHALSFQTPLGSPIGYAADRRLVLGFSDFELSTVEWWKESGHSNAVIGGSNYALEFVSVERAVVTDTNVIAFSGHELAIMTANTVSMPSQVKFLGYRSRARGLKSSPGGAIASIAGGSTLLDADMHAAKRLPGTDAIPIADDLALIKFTSADGSSLPVTAAVDPDWLEGAKPRRSTRIPPGIVLYDLATKKQLQRWPSANRVQFEPASQLMAIERGSKLVVAKLDVAARKFGPEHTIIASGADVMLLDPKQAGGKLALLVRRRGAAIEVQAVSDLAAPLPEPTRLTGKLEAVDRAGRIYLRADDDTIVVHGSGEPVRFTGMTGWTVRPDPTGARVAAFARSRLMLLDALGAVQWTVGFHGITDVAWTPGGELVALAGDLARVDVATGQVVAAQCGWGFALRTVRPEIDEFPSTFETLCDR